MPIVAVTGGVAAGKSTVTDLLRERGARVIDADVLAREAVEPGSQGLLAVVAHFGHEVLTPTGELDREALGQIVFHDPDARLELERIVHPVVRSLSLEAFKSATLTEPDRVVIYAVPLLAEAREPGEFDLVVVVDAPAAVRIDRLVANRGFTEADARARVSAQASDQDRLALADIVLDASGTLEETLGRAGALYEALVQCWPDRLDEAQALYATLAP
jgi:dephospho-CoA kinase